MTQESHRDELMMEDIGPVRLFTLNRPERFNALSPALFERFSAMLREAAADPAVRCVAVTGQGKAFCAGGDVSVQAADAKAQPIAPETNADGLRGRMECVRLLHVMPKPTVAFVNGVAAGAGMAIALACDLRIASEQARMTTAFSKVGLCGDYGGTYLLTRLVGPAIARDLYFFSPVLDIERLEALGLVSRRVSSDVLRDEGLTLAQTLADGPTLAYRYMKQSLNLAMHGSIEEVMSAEVFGTMRALQSHDHLEGAQAFMQKRKPAFTGA